MSPSQPVCSVFTEGIKPRKVPVGAVRDMMQIPVCTLASETLTHPAQGTANSTNNAGLSGLGKKKRRVHL